MSLCQSLKPVLMTMALSVGLVGTAISEVTLQSADGNVSISGELIEITDEVFVLSTAVGNLRLLRDEVRCVGDECPQEASVSILANAQLGQDVKVTANDQSLSISGTLTSFDDLTYSVQTEFGILKIRAEDARCEGPGCPSEITVPEASLSADILARLRGETSSRNDVLQLTDRPTTDTSASAATPSTTPSVGETASASLDTTASQEPVGPADGKLIVAAPLHLQDLAIELVTGLSDGGANKFDLVVEAANADLIFDHVSAANSRQHLLGFDVHAVTAAEGLGLTELMLADVNKVLAGTSVNWQDLGGPDLPISLHAQDGDGVLQVVSATAHKGPDGVLDAVAREPAALGLLRTVETRDQNTLPIRQTCGILSRADPISIQTGAYPLSKPVTLTLARDADAIAGRVFDFAQSDQASKVLDLAGLVMPELSRGPLTNRAEGLRQQLPSVRDADEQAQLSSLVDVMATADQLSAVFRFRGSSARLDATSDHLVDVVARYLQNQSDVSNVYIIGFTDNLGGFAGNQAESQQRAGTVAAALTDALGSAGDGLNVVELGVSELAPIACNQQSRGRALNRRVEVWVSATEQTPIQ